MSLTLGIPSITKSHSSASRPGPHLPALTQPEPPPREPPPCDHGCFHHNPHHPAGAITFHKVINPITPLLDLTPLLSAPCAQDKAQALPYSARGPVSSGPCPSLTPSAASPPGTVCSGHMTFLPLGPVHLHFPLTATLSAQMATGLVTSWHSNASSNVTPSGRFSWSPVQAGPPVPHCHIALFSFL